MPTVSAGLVCQYDVVCFDEISGVSFDQKDGVNIMKGYMESGEFSRGQGEHPRRRRHRDGRQLRRGRAAPAANRSSFRPAPPEMRDDTAFMDRIHAYLPGWDLPKVSRDLLTNHFGLVSDFLSECWNQLRRQSRQNLLQGRVHLGGALSGRDTTGVQKTVSGLIKLVSPNPDTPVPDEVLEWAFGSHWSVVGGSRNSKSASVLPSFVTPSSATRWAMTGWRSLWPRPSFTARAALAATLAAGTGVGYFARRR